MKNCNCCNCKNLSEKKVFSDGCVYQFCCFKGCFMPCHLINDNYCTAYKECDKDV